MQPNLSMKFLWLFYSIFTKLLLFIALILFFQFPQCYSIAVDLSQVLNTRISKCAYYQTQLSVFHSKWLFLSYVMHSNRSWSNFFLEGYIKTKNSLAHKRFDYATCKVVVRITTIKFQGFMDLYKSTIIIRLFRSDHGDCWWKWGN